MIVDVITSGISRVAPVVDGLGVQEHEVLQLYTMPNSNNVTHYADAELCDIRAFGLSSGFVRVMGGVTSFAGVIPVPAAPRVYNFYIGEPVRGLAFSPDGTSLGILYNSCLVILSIIHADTFHVYYFGPNHTDVFTGLHVTDDFAYVATITNEALRFSLHGPDYEHARLALGSDVRALISERDEWVTYHSDSRSVRFHNEEVRLPEFIGTVAKIVPTLDKDFVWCITNTELVIVSRTGLTAVLPIQIGCTADAIKTLPYRHGIVIAWHDPVAQMLHLHSFEFNPIVGEVVQVDRVHVGFSQPPRALALPASPLTRFHVRYPLMIMQRIRRAHIVVNAHMYPDPDADDEASSSSSSSETERDEEDEESDSDEDGDDEDEVVRATFNYPQPLSGLQQIIRRTRDYLPTLSETFCAWTPDEFGRVMSAARAYTGKRITLLHQQTAMLAYARENHRALKDSIETVVQDIARYYNGSASMGLLEDVDEEDPFAPYQTVIESVQPLSDPDQAERVIVDHLTPVSRSSIMDPIQFEAVEFKIDAAHQLGVHFNGLEADTIHAVNTGLISTLNCFKTEVQDLIRTIRLQKKLLKHVSLELARQNESCTGKRSITSDSPPAKRPSPE